MDCKHDDLSEPCTVHPKLKSALTTGAQLPELQTPGISRTFRNERVLEPAPGPACTSGGEGSVSSRPERESDRLIAQFDQYLETGDVDFARDGVGYHQLVLHLSDKEFTDMVAALNAAIGPFLAHRARPGRKRRAFATVLMPLDKAD